MGKEQDWPRGYLFRCFDLHDELKRLHYRRRGGDIVQIEKELAGVKSSRRLTYQDLEKIRDSRVWNADDFGYWPDRSEVEQSLESREWDFWNLPRNEDDVIRDLLEIFHQIELVSVILRFISPEHYGIISPPIENVLGIGPFPNHVEKYKTYLALIRQIRDGDRAFKTAAQVDMALWALQVGVSDGLLKVVLERGEFEALRSAFQRDKGLRAIRVGNLTRQLFDDISRPDLAEALLNVQPEDQRRLDLAGQIAGIEFERFVERLAGRRARDGRGLHDLVRELRPADQDFPLSWRNAVRTRNRAVHSNRPSKRDVGYLVEAMKQAEKQVSRRTN